MMHNLCQTRADVLHSGQTEVLKMCSYPQRRTCSMAVGAEGWVCNTLGGVGAVMPVREDPVACLAPELCRSYKREGGLQMNGN